jgi:uncharacterized protein YjeT (DUF2065 family)
MVNYLSMMPTIMSLGAIVSGGLVLYWTARLRRMIDSGKATSDPSMSPKTLRFAGIGLIVIGVMLFIAQFFVRLEF